MPSKILNIARTASHGTNMNVHLTESKLPGGRFDKCTIVTINVK
jgi:hypothetical protein